MAEIDRMTSTSTIIMPLPIHQPAEPRHDDLRARHVDNQQLRAQERFAAPHQASLDGRGRPAQGGEWIGMRKAD